MTFIAKKSMSLIFCFSFITGVFKQVNNNDEFIDVNNIILQLILYLYNLLTDH